MDEGRFQVAAGAVIERRTDGKILLVLRASDNPVAPGIWELPIGRLKQFESIEDGLNREIQEETAITDLEIIMPINTFDLMRGEHKAENEVKAIVFWCQTDQHDIVISPEHEAGRFFTLDEALERVDHSGIRNDLRQFRKLKDATQKDLMRKSEAS